MCSNASRRIAEAVMQFETLPNVEDLAEMIEEFLNETNYVSKLDGLIEQVEKMDEQLKQLRADILEPIELEPLNAGILANFTTVANWHHYIRALLQDAHQHYQQQVE